MTKLSLVGAGGHCRAAIEVAESMGVFGEIKIIDYRSHGLTEEKILGYEVVRDREWLYNLETEGMYFVSVGNNLERKRVLSLLKSVGVRIATLRHNTALIHKSATIGKGVLIGPFAHIGPDCKIGEGCIINTLANIEHESRIGCFSHCGPGSVVCGRCKVGKQVLLGARGTIIDGISVEDQVVIGAGSVVIRSITECGSVNVGLPTRKI